MIGADDALARHAVARPADAALPTHRGCAPRVHAALAARCSAGGSAVRGARASWTLAPVLPPAASTRAVRASGGSRRRHEDQARHEEAHADRPPGPPAPEALAGLELPPADPERAEPPGRRPPRHRHRSRRATAAGPSRGRAASSSMWPRATLDAHPHAPVLEVHDEAGQARAGSPCARRSCGSRRPARGPRRRFRPRCGADAHRAVNRMLAMGACWQWACQRRGRAARRPGRSREREKWSGRLDLNQRPPAPEAGALPSCATPRPRDGIRRLDVASSSLPRVFPDELARTRIPSPR